MRVDERISLSELVGDVADDARDLVRGEIALARAEMDRKLDRLLTGAVSLVGAIMLAVAGLIIILIAAAQALAKTMPDWAASLIVGGIVLLIGCILIVTARRALAPSGMFPQRTVDNLRADARVARESAT